MVLQNLKKDTGEIGGSATFYAGPNTTTNSKLLTNKRGEYITILKAIRPYRVMTFSYPTKLITMFPTENIQLIVHADHKNKPYPPAWEVRTNNKIHAKAAIGTEGIYLGSWNMSENSTENFHEIGI